MSLWLIFALLAAVCWSVGALLSKKGFENISPLWSNVAANFAGFLLWIPVALVATGFHIMPATPLSLLLITITGACYMSYFYAISQGKLALTGTLVEAYPAVTVVLSFIFLHEHVAPAQAFGIIVALAGSITIAWPSKGELRGLRDYSWIFWGAAGAALEGVGDFLAKVTVNQLGVYSQMFYLIIIFQFLTIMNFWLDKKGRPLPGFAYKYEAFLPSITGISLIVAGTMFLFFALQYGQASLVTPITASSPALIVVLAVVFLKERLTKTQLAGILAVLGGVLLISAG